MDPLSDEKVLSSWQTNATPWTAAVREKRIESRRLVTDQAIIDAVIGRRPESVIDLGCGEGWLVRALTKAGVPRVIGVDAVPALVDQARAAGAGQFHVATYEAIARGELGVSGVDVAVANFALIGKEAVDGLIRATAKRLLRPGGTLVIQTLHPVAACGDLPYEDGWRTGSWAGFGDEFTDPAPWYFRTIGSWIDLLHASGLFFVEIREPIHPATHKPASILFIATQSAPRG
jgi:SAM-dependent methyltransferase